MLRIGVLVGVITVASLSLAPAPTHRAPDPPNVYFGLLHAHTAFSDGSGTPEEAFAAARAAGLDFFAVTEHNHAEAESGASGGRHDGLLIATNPQLYSSPQPLTVTRRWKENGQTKTEPLQNVKSVVQAARDATNTNFIAIYGQEFSTISSGNHVNVLQIDDVLTSPNGNFRALFQTLAGLADASGAGQIVVQMNHPDVHRDLFYGGSDPKEKAKMRNDYGVDDGDLGPSFQSLLGASDRFVHLIEVLSGPAMATAPQPGSVDPLEDDYYFYLCRGYHLSPTAGQDNHYETWGTVSDARTGVLAESLSLPAIMSAFAANRTFATEDKNLAVVLRLTVDGHEHLMGDNAGATGDAELAFTVDIKDADEPNAQYSVRLIHGLIEPGTRDAVSENKPSDGFVGEPRTRTGNGTVVFDGEQAAGGPEFFYVRVTQAGGDRAWTAPVWVKHPRTWTAAATEVTYVWSGRPGAEVYHTPECSAAQSITAANRRSGPTPPTGRRPHSCVTDADGGGDH